MPHSVTPTELNSISKLLADSALKAYYRFESGALSTDTKGSFTLTNTNSVQEGSGEFGGGADFGTANTNKRLTVLNNLGVDGGAITVSMWVKGRAEIAAGFWSFMRQISDTSDVQYIIGYNYNSGTRQVYFARGKIGSADNAISSNLTIGTSDWYHLVLTYDGTNVVGYVNGASVGSTASSGNGTGTNTSQLSFGGYTGGQYASCLIDDVSVWSRALDADEVKILSGYMTPATELAKSVWASHANLKLHMKFDETSGTAVADSSGNSNNGTASAASIIANNIGGIFGNKGVFDGVSNKVTITDHATLKPTGAFSMGMWIKSTTTSNLGLLQSYSRNTAYAGIRLDISGGVNSPFGLEIGRNTGTVNGTDYKFAQSTTKINDGNWHFIVATWDGSNIRLYTDGGLDNTIAWAQAPGYATTNHVRIGSFCFNGTDSAFFNGSLDDLFLLNGTALSAEQVRELYESRLPGELYPTNGLQRLYHFNGNSKDYSGNHINGVDTNITYANSKLKTGAVFNGSSSKITAPTDLNSTALTYSWWLKTTTNGNMMIKSSDTANCLAIILTGTSIQLRRLNVVDMATMTVSTALNGNWHHYAITYNSTTGAICMYYDGKLLTSATNAQTFAWGNLLFGMYGGGSSIQYLNGTLDEFAIWNRILSETEIRKIYLKSIGRLQ